MFFPRPICLLIRQGSNYLFPHPICLQISQTSNYFSASFSSVTKSKYSLTHHTYMPLSLHYIAPDWNLECWCIPSGCARVCVSEFSSLVVVEVVVVVLVVVVV